MSVSVDVGRRYPGGCRDGHDAADVVGAEELRDRNRSRLDTDEVVHGWLVTCDGTKELLHLERWGLVYLGELERHLVHGHHMFIAGRLIASHGVVVGAPFGECSIERGGEPFGVQECVGDALGGDRMKVVASVPDERPAWSERLAEVAREVSRGVEALLTCS